MTSQSAPSRQLRAGQLAVQVYPSRETMGAAAAHDVATRIRQLAAAQERVRVVFAAAPSQNEFLAALRDTPDVPWVQVEAFHMDEYIGLAPDAPQSFCRFLRERLFGQAPIARIEYINGAAGDPGAEAERYSALLAERPIDIVCAGIGENGHIAFNDPPVADFNDSKRVKIVTLDDACRYQQVHDGAFAAFDQVPRTALTLTIPALLSARWIYCIVPGPTKTEAVRRTLHDPISTACPATVMRQHPQATLYLDQQSAAQV